jgi:hypothetical protein
MPGETTKWCEVWFKSFTRSKAIQTAAPVLVNIINVIVKYVFKGLSDFGKKYTQNAET